MRRKTTFVIFGLSFLLFLFSTGTNSQINRKKEILAMEGQVARVLGSQETTVRRFNPDKIKSNQIAIRLEYDKLNLSEKDLKKYALVSRNIIAKVEYVTARCANDVYYASNAVDKQRVEAFYNFNQKFFTNKKVVWGKIVQTGCTFDYEAQNWWHGFVITLKDITDGKGYFIKERIEEAIKREFIEGDILSEVLSWNADGKPQPPTQFRSSGAHIHQQTENFKAKTENGFILSLPSQSPVPTPVICDDKIFVSGGFNSSTYYAFTLEGDLIWGVTMNDAGPSSAVCGGKYIILSTESCTIFLLDRETGEMILSFFVSGVLPTTPAADNNAYYAVYPSDIYSSAEGNLAPTHVLGAFSLTDGKILWQQWVDSDVITAPVLAGKDIYTTTHSGAIYRFSKNDGTVLTVSRERATSPVFVAGSHLYYTKRIDEQTGKVAVEAPAISKRDFTNRYVGTGLDARYIDYRIQDDTPYSMAGVLYDRNGGLYSGAPALLHPEASFVHIGRKSVSTMQAYEGSHTGFYKNKIIAAMGTTVRAFDPLTKMLLWKYEIPVIGIAQGGSPVTSPSYAGGRLFFGTIDGKIIAIQVDTGLVVKEYDIGEPIRSQPLLYKGKIYAPTATGKLVVIDTGDPTIDGYTTWMQNP
ncbi:MAG: PQQ-binding-like beta-propeller repeat protein [Leptospirales bacterium]